MVLPNDVDLLNSPRDLERRKHMVKYLVPTPKSFLMDVKCHGCVNTTTLPSPLQMMCGKC